MNRLKSKIPFYESIVYLLRWGLLSLPIGILGGCIGGAFSRCVAFVTGFRQTHEWMLFLLPFAGLITVFLYHQTNEHKNHGTDTILASISGDDQIATTTGPVIFLATVLSHAFGASVGREGAALQIGGWLGSQSASIFRLNEKDRRIATMCGMAAVFSALFGTPVAAAVFSVEVISVGVFYYAALMPCIFSAFLGTGVAQMLGAVPDTWKIPELPPVSYVSILWAILLGLLCAGMSVLFCLTLSGARKLYQKYLPNAYIRILAGSAIFIGLTLLLGTRDYNGSSILLIDRAMEGMVCYEAFLLKLLFTAIALGAGFKGGEIVPTLVVGATFGAAFGGLTGQPVPLTAACGMIALFAGVTNCPISSVLIAMEMFHGDGLPYFAVTVCLSFALSGYYGLYHNQNFAYSKTRNEHISRKAK